MVVTIGSTKNDSDVTNSGRLRFCGFDDQHHNQRELYQTQYLRDSEQWSAAVVVLAVDVVDHMVELRGNRQYDAERGRCVDDVKLLRTRLFGLDRALAERWFLRLRLAPPLVLALHSCGLTFSSMSSPLTVCQI